MNEEISENGSDLNDDILNSSDSDDNSGSAKFDYARNPELSYGDIVIMIWRRIKMNEKMTDRLNE